MKILHTVESYLPMRHGMQEVVTQLSEKLVSMGHEVTVATATHPDRESNTINGVKIVEFSISGNYATDINGEHEKYVEFLERSDFDIITNFAAQQWATDVMLPILGKLKAKKIFVPTGFSGFYNPIYNEYFEKMKMWIKGYDANVFLSNNYRDINFAKDNHASNIVLIPNGASKSEFDAEYDYDAIKRKLRILNKSFQVLTVGSHTGLKGHNESIEIFKRTGLKNSVLIIIGNSHILTVSNFVKALLKTFLSFFSAKIKADCTINCFTKTALYNLSFKRLFDKNKMVSVSLKRKEIVALYKSTDVFLFPSNIECSPIVLFECCAAKLPFLVTDVGNSSEIIQWTQAGELLKTVKDNNGYSYADIESAATLLKNFYADEKKRLNFSHNGYKNYVEKFTWEEISHKYENLYKQILIQ